MAEEDLKDFLRKQARSLDGLLALTPAKMMFGEDVSDQWKRKKQTPEQKRAARMAKLDPANWKSAKDVYDERVAEALKKRKRDAGDVDESAEQSQDRPESSRPPTKKAKTNLAEKNASLGKITERQDSEVIQNENFKKRAKKRANRLKKNEEMRQKKQDKKTQKVVETEQVSEGVEVPARTQTHDDQNVENRPQKLKKDRASRKDQRLPKDQNMMEVDDYSALAGIEESAAISSDDEAQQANKSQATGTTVEEDEDEGEEDVEDDDSEYSTVTSSQEQAEVFSPPQESAASSVSSLQAPITQTSKPSKPSIPQPASDSQAKPTHDSAYDKQAARDRLQQALSGFRAQRKADDKAPRSRAELLAQRKQQEDERKTAKKEQKRREKEQEAQRQEEEMVRRFSPGGSGSLLGSPRSPMIEGGGNAFSFGRIAFEDGSQLNPSSLSATPTDKHHKGPQDAKTALQAAEAKTARLAGLDEQKRKHIETKDAWSSMNKRASGEKTKDNTSLLKKALKRQDKQKLKSSKEWNERKEGVQSSIDARQKKRTENLQARKDGKSTKKTGTKAKKRAGFEGSFRGRSGKTKKK